MPKSLCHLLIYVKHALVANFLSFNVIRENKILAKISGFTVTVTNCTIISRFRSHMSTTLLDPCQNAYIVLYFLSCFHLLSRVPVTNTLTHLLGLVASVRFLLKLKKQI